jgi:hypothetical protein
MFKKIILLSCVFSILIGLFSFAPHVYAAGEGSLGAYPTNYDVSNPKTKSWFIYELKPGETKEDSITVVNNADRTLNIKVYPVDATTTSDGAFALLNEDQRQNDVGSWVNISSDTVTIEPRGRKDVPFTISIPKYATVGDHAGGIIVQEVVKKNTSMQGVGLNIVSRVGTRIYESVPGDKVVKLDINDFSYKIVDDHLVFTFTMENQGNIILTPTGNIELKDNSGKRIDLISLGNLGSVFPGKPTTITSKSNISAPWFGQFTTTVTVNYSPTKAITKDMKFIIYIKDWKGALPVPALILLIILIYLVKRIYLHSQKIKELKQSIAVATEQPQPALAHVPVSNKAMKARRSMKAEKHEAVTEENVDRIFLAHHIRLLIILILFSIIALSALFAFLLQSFVLARLVPYTFANTLRPTISPTIAVSQAPTVVPTPIPTIITVHRSEMKVVVLNGGDKVGAAKVFGDKLTQDGFVVTQTENAPEDSAQTFIEYPQGMSTGAAMLIEELKPDYTDVIQKESSSSAVFTVTLGR